MSGYSTKSKVSKTKKFPCSRDGFITKKNSNSPCPGYSTEIVRAMVQMCRLIKICIATNTSRTKQANTKCIPSRDARNQKDTKQTRPWRINYQSKLYQSRLQSSEPRSLQAELQVSGPHARGPNAKAGRCAGYSTEEVPRREGFRDIRTISVRHIRTISSRTSAVHPSYIPRTSVRYP